MYVPRSAGPMSTIRGSAIAQPWNRMAYRPLFVDPPAAGADGEPAGGGAAPDPKLDWTPPSSQADLDRIIQDRVHRATSKFSNYDDLKAKADKHDALELELASDKDKAVDSAKKETAAAFVPKLVKAEFKAAAKGVLTADQLSAVLEDLDLSKFVDANGEVDDAKIATKITALTGTTGGAGGSGGAATPPPRGFGQGQQQTTKISAAEQGKAEAERRFKKTTA